MYLFYRNNDQNRITLHVLASERLMFTYLNYVEKKEKRSNEVNHSVCWFHTCLLWIKLPRLLSCNRHANCIIWKKISRHLWSLKLCFSHTWHVSYSVHQCISIEDSTFNFWFTCLLVQQSFTKMKLIPYTFS